jgi:Fe-S cluster biogenesis protein NfuA
MTFPSHQAQLLERLAEVRARLRGHGGDVVVRQNETNDTIDLEFVGACRGCPAIAFTYSAVVEPVLADVGVKVNVPQVHLSETARQRIRSLIIGSSRSHSAQKDPS